LHMDRRRALAGRRECSLQAKAEAICGIASPPSYLVLLRLGGCARSSPKGLEEQRI
jgi:hypothetical protein